MFPCPGCARHVRAAESVCPFCGDTLPLSLRQRRPVLPKRRLGRAATFAFGAALAASTAAGCGDGTDADAGPTDSGAVSDSGSTIQDSGPEDSGPEDGGPMDAGRDAGMMADAGDTTDSGPEDAGPTDSGPADSGPADAALDAGFDAGRDGGGGIIALYGGPAPIDAGDVDADVDAGPMIAPLYGGAPGV